MVTVIKIFIPFVVLIMKWKHEFEIRRCCRYCSTVFGERSTKRKHSSWFSLSSISDRRHIRQQRLTVVGVTSNYRALILILTAVDRHFCITFVDGDDDGVDNTGRWTCGEYFAGWPVQKDCNSMISLDIARWDNVGKVMW